MSQSAACKANTVKKWFSRQTSVSIEIAKGPDAIWSILTNASEYAKWNSTIVELAGEIAPGGRIELKSTLSPERTFKLKVKEFEPNKRLAWGDAMGTRVFTLDSVSDEVTRFEMTETIGGPIFPLFAKMIPPFDESFEQFASDLKSKCEAM